MAILSTSLLVQSPCPLAPPPQKSTGVSPFQWQGRVGRLGLWSPVSSGEPQASHSLAASVCVLIVPWVDSSAWFLRTFGLWNLLAMFPHSHPLQLGSLVCLVTFISYTFIFQVISGIQSRCRSYIALRIWIKLLQNLICGIMLLLMPKDAG